MVASSILCVSSGTSVRPHSCLPTALRRFRPWETWTPRLKVLLPGIQCLVQLGSKNNLCGGGMTGRYLLNGFCFICMFLAIPVVMGAQGGPQMGAANSLGEYVFTPPPGWGVQQYPDGIVIS